MMPEMIPPRVDYIKELYQRIQDYIRAIPTEEINDEVLQSLRYILAVYYETEGGISYREMASEIMLRFTPELYIHGYVVGEMAQAVCGVILDHEPGFFDAIPGIAELSAEEKRAAMEDMAFYSGLLHDVGKVYLTTLYNHASRQMLHSEDEALELHAVVGYLRLKAQDSCRDYADAAYGHHRWYDGSDGYPAGFVRKQSDYRLLVDLIGFTDFLDSDTGDEITLLPERDIPFEEKINEASALSGRRFSPLITGWLRTADITEKLKDLYYNGRQQILRNLI